MENSRERLLKKLSARNISPAKRGYCFVALKAFYGLSEHTNENPYLSTEGR